jgi:hypothetical protein
LKKSLDSPEALAYSPPPVAIVTAVVTGAEIGRRRGDATLEDNRRRLSLLPLTLPPKPKGLRRENADGRLSGHADKNARALRRVINFGVADAAQLRLSLVVQNVDWRWR